MTHAFNRKHINPNLVPAVEGVPWNHTRERYIQDQYNNILNDLKERLERANEELLAMLKEAKRYNSDNPRAWHLASKAEGVRLALSYLEEYL